MSETKKLKRYIGKLKNSVNNGVTYQNILMENLNHQNEDGSANPYYKGALVWADVETGKNYQVKQMSITVPKGGMKKEHLDRGFTCFITIDLENDYQVTVLA